VKGFGAVLGGLSDEDIFAAAGDDRIVTRLLEQSKRNAEAGMAKPLTSGLDTDSMTHVVLEATAQARQDFGRTRIELGFLLIVVKEQKLWHGKAENFSAFLHGIRLNSNAANQYMKVADAFMRDNSDNKAAWTALPEETMRILCTCSMAVMTKAADLWRNGDRESILAILDTLSDEDAAEALDSMRKDIDCPGRVVPELEDDPRVKRVLRQIEDLPAELRSVVRAKTGFR